MNKALLPWKTRDHWVEAADGSDIAVCFHAHPEANARLIVAAVNSYDASRALIEQMRDALRFHHVYCSGHDSGYHERGDDALAFRATRNALAAAEKFLKEGQ